MMIQSVLLIAISLTVAQCRRLTDDIDNEISPDPARNMGLRETDEWVKISQLPVKTISKKVGAHVELHCEAMGSPPPTIQWFKGNHLPLKITENESFDSNLIGQSTGLAKVTSRLVINYLLPRHDGVYRCVASNGASTMAAQTRLIVSNKEGNEMNFTQLISANILGAYHISRVTFWASAYMDVIGSDVILPCKFVGNPKPTLVWYDPNGKAIENEGRFSVLPEGELRIRSLMWSDMGSYTCTLDNTMGTDSVETFLYPMKEASK